MRSPYPPTLICDFYKTQHLYQYPKGTTHVYSTWIPRESKLEGVSEVVSFGFQYFAKEWLQSFFQANFFGRPKSLVLSEYRRFMHFTLGIGETAEDVPDSHFAKLHDLGYIPVRIMAVPEGTLVPLRVPMLTIENTHPDFYWVVNWLETIFSAEVWQMSTSATIAFEYRKDLTAAAIKTGGPVDFVPFQGHDFSMRGMEGLQAAAKSGAGHLLAFTGTDTIPAVAFLEHYYNADIEKELVGTSIPATEHSVMCAYGSTDEEELAAYQHLITETYPGGFVSIVSDTRNLWDVITKILPKLKEDILTRDGKVVIRPDSGDPVDIICGSYPAPDPRYSFDRATVLSPEEKGVIELLWELFGGTTNEAGYKELDSHIGAIYGDSITLARAKEISRRLEAKGFASTNVVYGIGSYCVSPDTLILCADLMWRRAGDIQVGEEIVAFDEDKVPGQGKGHSRRYTTATITANNPATKKCSKVYTERGDCVTASDDHPWLVWIPNTRERGLAWRKTSELRPGDELAFFGEPWETDTSRSGGWLAGIFDGEGSFAKQTGDRRIPAYRPNVVQNEGIVLDQILSELDKRGFSYNINETKKARSVVLNGGWRGALRFLGKIRPERLMERLPEILSGGPSLWKDRTFDRVAVDCVDSIPGYAEVASISTSAGTFITDGYLTHNTYQYVTRDTFGFALKSTWVKVDGVGKAIFKDPATDKKKMKKSLKGRVVVAQSIMNGKLMAIDGLTELTEQALMPGNILRPIFQDGQLLVDDSLSEIRERLLKEL